MKKKILLSVIMLVVTLTATADVKINEENFPDENFRNYVLSAAVDRNKNCILDDDEIQRVTDIDVHQKKIVSMKGIEFFTELHKLTCYENPLTELDLSNNTKLDTLNCAWNKLTSLNVKKCAKLRWIRCDSNNLPELDVSECTELKLFVCSGNRISALDVSACTELDYFNCAGNNLTVLDLSNNTELTTLGCSMNHLATLDLSNNTKLMECHCSGNAMTRLILSKDNVLNSLACSTNQLYGAAMEHIIENLNYQQGGFLAVFNAEDKEKEKNIITTIQVATLNAKGWNVYQWIYSSYCTYLGSEPQDDYIPFVKAGKKWNVIRSDFDGGYHHVNYRLMNEKVEKAGKTYMKMYRSEDDMTAVYDAGLLREENRKVYLFDSDMQKEFLMFDYSLKVGDTYETFSYDEQKVVSYKVLSVNDCTEGPDVVRYDYDEEADSTVTQHRYLRKWIVCSTDDNSIQKTWIEGVGSLEGPLANLYDERPVSTMDYLAYVECVGEDAFTNPYLPFTFYDTMNRIVHGCNMSSGTTGYSGNNSYEQFKFTYELEGNRLHVYGQGVSALGKHYVYIIEVPTDDPLLRKLHFEERGIEPIPTGIGLGTLDFYVPGFDPNMNYIVVDNRGEEHPVINKTPQMAYRPMIEEGKVWKVGTISGNPVQVVDYYYFDGDTIIDGKACKQMMCQRYVSPDYSNEYWTPTPSLSKVGAWYEENKKVYVYDAQNKQHKLMYDFSLEPYDTLQFLNMEGYPPLMIGPKQTGGLKGFKGVYRNLLGINIDSRIYTSWLEGVGGIMGPIKNTYYYEKTGIEPFLMSCTVGDEVIYLNDEYQDGATPETSNAPKQRLDFTHIIKTKPQAPIMRVAEQPLYGEYNDQQLGINLDPLAEAYLVRITDESGKAVYEKAINAGNIVALNIDISAYPKGRYTVTVENSRESFTGQFNAQTAGIVENAKIEKTKNVSIYNLQGQRISTLKKGLNIVNGRKVLVK